MLLDVRLLPAVRPLLAAAALLAGLPAAASSTADPATLGDLAPTAELVVVGAVLSVDAVGTERVATVAVERAVTVPAEDLVTVSADLGLGDDADLVPGRPMLMVLEPDGAGGWRCVAGERGCFGLHELDVDRAADLAALAVAGDEATFVAALKQAAVEPFVALRAQAAAMDELARHLRRSDAPWLVAQLAPERDPLVRAWAAHRLADLDAVTAAPAIARLLEDPARDVRQAGLDALVALDPSAAVPALRAALRDPEVSIRRTAVAGLRRASPRDLGPTLLEALRGETDLFAQLEVAEALVALPDTAEARAALALRLHPIVRQYLERKLGR